FIELFSIFLSTFLSYFNLTLNLLFKHRLWWCKITTFLNLTEFVVDRFTIVIELTHISLHHNLKQWKQMNTHHVSCALYKYVNICQGISLCNDTLYFSFISNLRKLFLLCFNLSLR